MLCIGENIIDGPLCAAHRASVGSDNIPVLRHGACVALSTIWYAMKCIIIIIIMTQHNIIVRCRYIIPTTEMLYIASNEFF